MVTQSADEGAMFRIIPADSEAKISQARNLFREYAATLGVGVCLGDYDRELATLPGRYAPPEGRLVLAIEQSGENKEEAIGCAALRKFEEGTCELKRLYVRPQFRGQGVARELVQDLIAQAKSIGYRRVVLDTLPSMREAHRLYEALGFHQIAAYQKDPILGSLFFELPL
jgi:ribosomal protein S18 acetylase RimI-like enzyme